MIYDCVKVKIFGEFVGVTRVEALAPDFVEMFDVTRYGTQWCTGPMAIYAPRAKYVTFKVYFRYNKEDYNKVTEWKKIIARY